MVRFSVPVNSADIIILLILGIMFLIGLRVVHSFFKKPSVPKMDQVEEAVTFHKDERLCFFIDGMMCGMCESHVKDAIRKALPGAREVTASHESGEAAFIISEEENKEVLSGKLHDAIEPLGYRIISDVRMKSCS